MKNYLVRIHNCCFCSSFCLLVSSFLSAKITIINHVIGVFSILHMHHATAASQARQMIITTPTLIDSSSDPIRRSDPAPAPLSVTQVDSKVITTCYN